MDNIIEIVVFVAILLLSVLGGAKKKKTAKQNAPTETDKEVTFKDIWKELTGDEYSQPDTYAPAVPIPSPQKTYAQPEQQSKDREHVFSGMESSKEFDYLKETPKPKKIIQGKLRDNPSKEPMVSESGNINEDLIKNFDIRKAVLYSEILAPKFKEY